MNSVSPFPKSITASAPRARAGVARPLRLQGPVARGGKPGEAAARDRRAVHLPDRDVAARIPPQDVRFAVAVEIAGADDVPVSRIGKPGEAGTRNLRAVHLPDRDVAAGVPPQDVGFAVAVEIGGADDVPVSR